MAPSPNALPEGRVVEVGGRPVAVHVGGSGPAVLLVHGSGPGTTAATAWAATAAGLLPRHRVIAPDLAGFGGTPAPPGDDSKRAHWTAQLLGLLDALGEPSCAVVGHSLGGALALGLAVARPEAVTRIVAVGSLGAPMALPPGLDALWGATPDRASARAVLELLFADPAAVTEAAVDARLAAMLAPGAARYDTLFPPPRRRWLDDITLTTAELRSVAVPVLLVHGAVDRVVPLREGLGGLLELLPDARPHVFADCGHAVPAERGPELTRLLTTFLEDHV